MDIILIYIGSVVIIAWGIAHIAPTRAVVRGFEPTSTDNRRIITMEWVMEGLALIFIGALVMVLTLAKGVDDGAVIIVYKASAIMLLVMGTVSAQTGARTSILPMKMCPYVKSAVALLFVVGSLI